MTTTMDLVAPTASLPDRAAVARPSKSSGHRTIMLLAKLVAPALVVGLAAFNIWWYRRDTRPLPALTTAAGWIAQERFAEAEPTLREHLRRSPHDGEARIMLARVRAAFGDFRDCARQLHEVAYWWPQKGDALYREGQAYLKGDRAKDAET